MRQYSSLELLSCLHHQQSKLNNLQFSGIKKEVDWKKFAAQHKDWARIERIRLCLDNSDDCGQAAEVLAQTHNLKSLDVDLNHEDPANDDIDGDGIPTMNLLLGNLNASNECSQLTSLRLSRVKFPDDNYADCKLLRVPALRNLTLYNCSNYGTFLGHLAKLSLDLDSFSIVEEPGHFYEPDFATYGEEFLRSIKAPRRVALILEGDDEQFDNSNLDSSCFHAYASTITSMKLKVHPFLMLSWFSKASEFSQFCIRASSLQQLSISGIEVQPTLCEKPDGLRSFLVCPFLFRRWDQSC